jgi:hypothetical protein
MATVKDIAVHYAYPELQLLSEVSHEQLMKAWKHYFIDPFMEGEAKARFKAIVTKRNRKYWTYINDQAPGRLTWLTRNVEIVYISLKMDSTCFNNLLTHHLLELHIMENSMADFERQLTILWANHKRFRNIQHLYLTADSKMTWYFPKKLHFERLRHIEIFGGYSLSIPQFIFSQKGLETLRLQNMELRSISPSIKKLVNLIELNLDANFISTIPKEIKWLTNLEILSIQSNLINCVPNEINALPTLQSILLFGNVIETFPKDINPKYLSILDLGYNQISTIPQSLSSMSNLSELDLSFNTIGTEEVESLKKLLPSCEVKCETI